VRRGKYRFGLITIYTAHGVPLSSVAVRLGPVLTSPELCVGDAGRVAAVCCARGGGVESLRKQSRIRYSLPPPGFSESGIHSASATGTPLGFLWIHVQGFKTWANKNLDSEFFSSLRGFPT